MSVANNLSKSVNMSGRPVSDDPAMSAKSLEEILKDLEDILDTIIMSFGEKQEKPAKNSVSEARKG